MTRYEFSKLISPVTVVLLVILFAVRIFVSFLPRQYDIAYSKAVYKEYMKVLEGKTATEAAEYIEAEKAWLETALNADVTEDMTLQEQFAVTEDLSEAQRKTDAFQAVYEKYLYFCEQEEKGRHPVFFYDLDWLLYLDDDGPDWLLLLLLAGIIVPYFTNDCGKIHSMLFCTGYGRKKLMTVKLAVAAAFGCLITILFNLSDACCFVVQSAPDYYNAPIYSMQTFQNCTWELSLAEYTMLKDTFHVLWSIAAILVSALLSIRYKNAAFASLLIVAVIFIPFLIGFMLPTAFKTLSIGGSLGGHTPLQVTQPLFAWSCLSYCLHIVLLWIGCIKSWCTRN